MDLKLIFNGEVTPWDLQELHDKRDMQFVINNGQIDEVIYGS